NFEEDRGLSFSTFAATRVRGAMLDELRRQDRVPRSVRAKARQLHAIRDALGNRLGRTPTQRELAKEAGMPIDKFWQWQSDVDRAGQVSLDAPVGTAGNEAYSFGERLACLAMDPVDRLDREHARECLRDAMCGLSETEQRVLSLYFFEDKTMQEIAPDIGVSESRVSQIRTRALGRLRQKLTERGIRAA
ncbi:MAG: sigma-70 family RNA polymerase sigma factor, partial [Gemmatimonadaceae bacterium]